MKTSFLVLTSIVAGLFMLAISSQFGEENGTARIILSYSFAIFVFIMLHSAFDRKNSLLMIVVSFYHAGMFLGPGMLHCAQGWFPFYGTRYNTEDIISVSVLVALYSTGMLAGYWTAYLRKAVPESDTDQPVRRSKDSTVLILSVASIAVCIPCIAAIGIDQFIGNRGELTDYGLELTPAVLVFLNIPRIASFCAATALGERVIARRNLVLSVLWVPILAFAVTLNNPITMPRYYFFGLILVLVYASGKIISARSKLIFVGAVVFGLVIVFPLINTLSRGKAGDAFEFDPAIYLSTHGDFDGLQSTLSTYLLVERDGLSYGARLLGAVFTFVPREIWPTKPYATGQDAGEIMGFDFVNLSAPIPAEIYVDFGILGLIFIPFWVGYLGGRLDRRAQHAIQSGASLGVRLLYGGLIGYATIVCRGSLLAVISPVYLYFGIALIWYRSETWSRPGARRVPLSAQRR
jgi:oligosaccharide repeat unit polymerase